MLGIVKLECKKNGMAGTLLMLYILHTLKKEPKSGYEIIGEISEKTEGKWVPSKGALYPLLKKMEANGYICQASLGRRAKKIYQLTKKGEKSLEEFMRKKEEARKKVYLVRKLLHEIFGGDEVESMLWELWDTAKNAAGINHEKTLSIIEKCISDLRGVKK